jgi:hypothetical protein
LLRRTFASFEPSERRLIGELIARGGTPVPIRDLDPDLDAERVATALATMAQLLGIDR